MSQKETSTDKASDREFVIERIFDAPRQLVFQAWTKAEHLKHWWGPKGWTLPVCNIDFRPGGVWHYCMRGPEGEESWGKAIYQEIVESERIVYIDNFSDAEGNVAPGMPQTLITVEFADHQDKTRISSRVEFATPADREATLAIGMAEGLNETWDRLEEYLAQR